MPKKRLIKSRFIRIEAVCENGLKTKLLSFLALLKYEINKTDLNDLRKIIYLRKSEVSFEIILVCNVTGNLAEHGIHCLP